MNQRNKINGNNPDKSVTGALVVNDLSIVYKTRSGVLKAVDKISFKIKDTQGIGIIGESGSGKSTLGYGLMRSLAENGSVVSGSFIFEDQDILNISEKDFNEKYRWKKISMVFQGSMNSLDPVFTIEDQMKEILSSHRKKISSKDRISIIRAALTDVGLNPDFVSRKYPHELSGGMKQRIVIANALLLGPRILIADEPTTALDVVIQSQVLRLLKKLREEKNMKIIVITHDMSLIPNLVDRVIIMYAGQAVEISDVKTVFEKPLHPYTQALIQSIPNIRSSEKSIKFIKGDPPNLSEIGEGCRFIDRCPHAFEDCKNDPPDILIGNNLVKCWLYKK
ncbi:ABC transporter ATP-binding protein [Candidatus Nitrosocosmicus arcticus]|uniref:ABC-type dipeptide/oligopeptide/nickel transport system, ATPase component n=1 Tax=Candidatus Nitrosocosmicus arcticus TaxID=2035267 RepID=A0A557SUF4_9ARCH|nr:ABC transporter ATP-binding protein [Candidatus Nitrosocosmicus arcticus]TVP40237.1 ABC-type dipeptide/oligopeptide/nickel transport system, ATPase component [Candidatus Nitrosocosmicus arcticus]